MIVDANTVPLDSQLEADICVIGAGAAGLAITKSLSGTNLKIAILESGDFSFNQETQSLYEGKNVGLPYFPLQAARLRFFGGTTNHWGGWCDPFSPMDFEVRDGIPHTGWPIEKADLDPYYDPAAEFCGVESNEWATDNWEAPGAPALRFPDGRMTNNVVQITTSANRHLGSIHRQEITEATGVDTYLNANVTGIVCNEAGLEVSHVEVATLAGNHFTLKARRFILATGGVENPRLLLLSTARHPKGIGNEYDLVGRFFCDHPRFSTGRIFLTKKTKLDFYGTHDIRGTQIKGQLTLSPSTQRSEQLVNVQLRFTPVYEQEYVDALRAKSGSSLLYMLKSVAAGEFPDEFSKHLSRVVFDIENLPSYVYSKMLQDQLPVNHIELWARVAPAPNPDSRVRLSSTERDALGQPRVELDWRLSSLDRQSAVRGVDILGEELGMNGLGRVQVTIDELAKDWPDDLAGGFHHMCTTRMSDDPKTGVVDKNCKVHGVSNLYVAGSSVFCTSGSGSPTLTLVALALRLADHIKNGMAKQ